MGIRRLEERTFNQGEPMELNKCVTDLSYHLADHRFPNQVYVVKCELLSSNSPKVGDTIEATVSTHGRETKVRRLISKVMASGHIITE